MEIGPRNVDASSASTSRRAADTPGAGRFHGINEGYGGYLKGAVRELTGVVPVTQPGLRPGAPPTKSGRTLSVVAWTHYK